jgi:hypothetical protein
MTLYIAPILLEGVNLQTINFTAGAQNIFIKKHSCLLRMDYLNFDKSNSTLAMNREVSLKMCSLLPLSN